ncbi:Nif3-like dinuclear metal center hexameric protein [Hydrogenimonas cancrithermarum]|uniref:GTP cyclohydrolase 1 type 2 n=1 Tax=Hydrogenimonas cancrithermarum TaxID=2993563 RepID=A0ABM8FM03_9BACT|nr:Nif3-like dinuclear metal center hexameric protein [Hydrogenimonas cancrithermarum]BDY13353.1 GTP cyclohydrolase 1 type 2 [Hydrogenimonas cancrithermarum]
MTVGEVYGRLDELSPFELQEKWDNSGLLLGDESQRIEKVVLSVDIDAGMIEAAEENTLFVLHHPLIFSGLKRLLWSEYPANLLREMIRKNHAMIAMHTNFDQTHLNRYVFEKVLGFQGAECEGFVCRAEGKWEAGRLLKEVKTRLGLETLRIVGKKETIRSVSMTTGSGASLMDSVEADLFLTGDIKFHDAMKALSKGLMMADIGHFESEKYFAEALGAHLKNLPIPVIIAQSINPFGYI